MFRVGNRIYHRGKEMSRLCFYAKWLELQDAWGCSFYFQVEIKMNMIRSNN